ncbi:TPA: hypothetical protein ACSPZY_001376 [Aeromonas veronii]|uniref:hypothetical protein n=1 Tax=Aeromonas TaxID=642 RepID=UPI00191CBB2B|nr:MULTISPECIES: hypothetical protein [Aeromonas]MBL0621747.1 hypothetical protein [Aeromonas veronii]MCQ4110605.1 hypothetical protein [Aeromonas sp. JL9]
MVGFEYGAEVVMVAEGLFRTIMTVQVVRADSVVCSYKMGDVLYTVELNPASLRLATEDDRPSPPMIFMKKK